MSNATLELMKKEHERLAKLADDLLMGFFRMIPIMFAVGGAVLVYAEKNGIVLGLSVGFGIALVACWLGCAHSLLLGVGLRVAELDCRIRKAEGGTPTDALGWDALVTAEGSTSFRGWIIHVGLAAFIGMLLLLVALKRAWTAMEPEYSAPIRLVAVLLPILVVGIVIAVVVWVEKRTKAEKRRILKATFEAEEDVPTHPKR